MVLEDCGNGIFIEEEQINNFADSIIKLLKKELPEKFQCQCVISEILSCAEKKLSAIHLDL